MEQKVNTSFIPKKSLKAATQRPKGSSIGVFFLLTLIIFIGVLALAIGVFLYQQFLVQNIDRKEASLERASAAFEPALIAEISRLDTRLQSAQDIIDNHMSVTAFFKLLEVSTLASVRFEDLDYRVGEGGRISISMKGKALNFSSVALQSDIFGKNKFIREPIFSNLNLDQKGDVVFNFSAFIDPRLLSYRNTREPSSQ